MNEQIRNQYFPSKVSKFEVNYYIFGVEFKLPIVKDSIEYKNDKKKSDGYSLKDGKKSTTTTELFVNNGRIPKKN